MSTKLTQFWKDKNQTLSFLCGLLSGSTLGLLITPPQGYSDFLYTFVTEPSLPALLQNISLGLITISIPIIALLIQKQFKGDSDDNLSLQIQLNHVIQYKLYFFATALSLVLPTILPAVASHHTSLILVTLWVIAMSFCVWRLYLSTLYSMSPQYKKQTWLKYLEKTIQNYGESNDLIEFWEGVLSRNYDNKFEDNHIIISFHNDLLHLLEKKSGSLPSLLKIFHNNLSKRDKTFLLYFDTCLPKLLELRYCIWHKTVSSYIHNERAYWGMYQESEHYISLILSEITRIAFASDSPGSFQYFKYLEEHAKAYQNKELLWNGNPRAYSDRLPINNPQQFFDLIPEARDSYDIWQYDYFPREWKITKKTISDPQNKIARHMLAEYLDWSIDLIRNSDKQFNNKLNEVSRELFPDTEPWLFARIMHLLAYCYDNNLQWAQNKMAFGLGSRVMITSDVNNHANEFEALIKEQEKNTLELAVLCFPAVMNEKFLLEKKGAFEKFIEDNKALTGSEKKAVSSYISLCEELLNELKNKRA
jgi:hypothetical protein